MFIDRSHQTTPGSVGVSPEYLVALMLQTHRPNDLARARIFWDQKKVDPDGLAILIDRYELDEQWQRVLNL